MKANELRIGNHIEYYMEDSQDERQKWWEMDIVDAETILHFQTFPEDADYRPIKITAEIAFKLGLECLGKKREWYDIEINKRLFISININSGAVAFSFDYYNWITMDEYKILYVHQFENLYFTFMNKELVFNL